MNKGSVSQVWFNILLKQAGMTEKDVSIVNMTADDAAAAFMAGQIGVAVTWEPHLTLAKEQKVGKVLVSSDQTPGLIVDVIALRCDVIEKQPEDVKALVAGPKKRRMSICLPTKTRPMRSWPRMGGCRTPRIS